MEGASHMGREAHSGFPWQPGRRAEMARLEEKGRLKGGSGFKRRSAW